MKDLHEGVLREFAERAATSLEEDVMFQRYGLRVVRPRLDKASGMAHLRALRKKQGRCQQCGDPATATLCDRHAAARRKAA